MGEPNLRLWPARKDHAARIPYLTLQSSVRVFHPPVVIRSASINRDETDRCIPIPLRGIELGGMVMQVGLPDTRRRSADALQHMTANDSSSSSSSR